jgi:predicted membrane GTPase involved in stress response
VEVTPQSVRIRKTVLDAGERARILKKQKPPRD